MNQEQMERSFEGMKQCHEINQQWAYSQQKNREYIYFQATHERQELMLKEFRLDRTEEDQSWIDSRYEQLCQMANITAWGKNEKTYL